MAKKKFEVITILFASILYCMFCNWIMIELPHLSWFDYLPLVDKFFNKTLHITDLFTRYCEHGMFGYNILFLINASCFKLTTFFDVYLNDIIVISSGIIYIIILGKIVNINNKSYKIGVILITLVQFSTIQLSSGAMETQVRLGIILFLVTALFVDSIFINNIYFSNRKLILTCLLIIISINIFGTLYSFAGLPAICVVGLLLIFKNKSRINNILPILLTYIIATILYIFEYDLFGGNGGVNSTSIFDNVIAIILHPILSLKSLLGYNASGLFGASVFLDNKLPVNTYLWIGLVTTFIIIYSVYKFITNKIYEKTYLPLFLIAYSFVVFILLIVGRANSGWQWYLNEWYIVHTKLQFIGVIWILIYSYQRNEKRQLLKSTLIYISCGIILFLCVIGNITELKRAPYIAQYYEEKQPYLFINKTQELPTDENGNTPLLASIDVTYNSIEILKKYGLSVFKYYPIYEKYEKDIKFDENLNYDMKILDKDGYFEDNWIGEQAEISIYTETGKFNLKLFCPFEYDQSQTGVLYINDKKYSEYNFEQQNTIIPVTTQARSIVKIKFRNNFSVIMKPDIRKLCFTLKITE